MMPCHVTPRTDTETVATDDHERYSVVATTVNQAYRFAIDPTAEQANLSHSHIGGTRAKKDAGEVVINDD